jgi:hypothetical protein
MDEDLTRCEEVEGEKLEKLEEVLSRCYWKHYYFDDSTSAMRRCDLLNWGWAWSEIDGNENCKQWTHR